jgi:hypothetical protein
MHAELPSQITGTKLQGRRRTKERMHASILCIDDLLLSLTSPLNLDGMKLSLDWHKSSEKQVQAMAWS